MSEVDDLLERVVVPNPKKLRLLFYDIETAPMMAFLWSLRTHGYVNQKMLVHDKFMFSWAAKWSDDTEMMSAVLGPKEARDQNDRRIVKSLAKLMKQADYVVAHNGDRFDLPVVNARIAANRLEPLGSTQTLDTLKISRQALGVGVASHSLDYLTGFFGLERKYETGLELWKQCYHGHGPSLQQMSEYNRQDVNILEQLFWELVPYAKRLPRLVDMTAWRDDQHCPVCGSAERRKIRKPHRTPVNNFPQFRCGNCQRTYRVWQSIGNQASGVVGT
jgi:uncharacterized protein YprB with RNaseH-like and TPR domain